MAINVVWTPTIDNDAYGYVIKRASSPDDVYDTISGVSDVLVSGIIDVDGNLTDWYKIVTQRIVGDSIVVDPDELGQQYSASIVYQPSIYPEREYVGPGDHINIKIGTYVSGDTIHVGLVGSGGGSISTSNINTDSNGVGNGQCVVPSSVGEYTIRSTYNGTTIANRTIHVSSSISSILSQLKDLLFEFQHIKVFDDTQVEFNVGCSLFKFAFNNWSREYPPQFLMDNGILVTNNYYIDYDTGIVGVSGIPRGSYVTANYVFQYFTDNSLVNYINQALNEINLKKPYTGVSIEAMPLGWDTPVIYGAYRLALRRLLQGLMFRDQQLILAGDNAIPIVQGIYNQTSTEFTAMLTQVKRRSLVSPSVLMSGRYRVPIRVTDVNWRQYAGIIS